MYLHYMYRRFFLISRIIKGKISIISKSWRLWPTMLTERLLVVDIMKNQSWITLLYTDMWKKIFNSTKAKDFIPQYSKKLALFHGFSAGALSSSIFLSNMTHIQPSFWCQLSSSRYVSALSTWQILPVAFWWCSTHEKICRIISSSQNRNWDFIINTFNFMVSR